MPSETSNTADELRRLIAEGYLSEDALQAITGISGVALASFLRDAPSGKPRIVAWPAAGALSDDESVRVSTFAAQLTSFDIDDDARLKAIFESLTIDCLLTLENIAQLTGLDVEDLASALRDPRTVPIERKYELAIRGSYLVNAFNRARGQ